MKGSVVAVLVIVLLAVVGGAYLLLQPPSSGQSSSSTTQSLSSTAISISQAQSTTQATTSSSHVQITNPTAQVSVSAATCSAASGKCVITLVNAGGTAAEATGCTLNGQTGVFSPASGQVPPGGSLDVSCAPAAGGAIPIPRFHVEGVVQLSDGSTVRYSSSWE